MTQQSTVMIALPLVDAGSDGRVKDQQPPCHDLYRGGLKKKKKQT